MLSIEEIKKACEFADGFEWETDKDGDGFLTLPNRSFMMIEDFRDLTDDNFTSIYYPLFLQRVIEGINRSEDYGVVQNDVFIEAYGQKYQMFRIKKSSRNMEEVLVIDQAKEQAIKYILEQI